MAAGDLKPVLSEVEGVAPTGGGLRASPLILSLSKDEPPRGRIGWGPAVTA